MKKIFTFLLCLCMFILPVFFAGCNNNKTNHTIFLTSENQRLGDVLGSGTYLTDKEVTIEAKVKSNAPEGTEFIVWLKGGKVASYENPYKFTANGETEGKYTAVFSYEYLKLVQLREFEFTQSLSETSNIQSVTSIKFYLDNKEYFQPTVYESSKSITKQLDSSLSFSTELENIYVFNCNELFYGSIEIEYEINDETKISKTTSFTQKLINPEDNTLTLLLNDIDGSTKDGVILLKFETLSKPQEQEAE